MEDSSEENKAARERAAIKVLDYTYNIILQEDRLSIQKAKVKPEEDDDDDDTPDITVSLKAIK